ncbi:MAG: hypothetical protein R3B72_17730 [Polyangiaceae bacterium]
MIPILTPLLLALTLSPGLPSESPSSHGRPALATTTEPRAPWTARRLRFAEVDSSLGLRARAILEATRDEGFGHEVRFNHRGRRLMARIERHYHEPGGPARPWGWHRGVSLFAVAEPDGV